MTNNTNGKKITIPVLIMALIATASGSWALATSVNGYKISNIDAQTVRNKTHITALEAEVRIVTLELVGIVSDVSYIRISMDKLEKMLEDLSDDPN